MMIVTDKQGEAPILWQWMNSQTRLPWSSDLRTIGLLRDNGTVAATVAFNAWTYQACWMHVAFDNPHCLSRKLLKAAFDYPFNVVGVRAVYGLTPKDNEEAIRLNKKVGFKQIAETVDCIMFELRREDCRWIQETH